MTGSFLLCDILPCRASLVSGLYRRCPLFVASPGLTSYWPPPFLTPQEQEFLQKQQQDLDGALKKIIQQHKLEISTIERDCLNHKQQLLRGGREISSDQ